MRQLVLALLAGGTGHGYDLKRSYEQNFGSIWTPTNDGQMYVTLSRLDGLNAGGNPFSAAVTRSTTYCGIDALISPASSMNRVVCSCFRASQLK